MTPDWGKFLKVGLAQVGKPYLFGYKPAVSDPNPKKFDCSALVFWLYAQIGYNVPDGSQNQFDATLPATEPQLGDLAFLRKPGQPTHHVGIVWQDNMVLEAHGSAVWGPNEPTYKVILRPQSEWLKQRDFTGWRCFKSLV